MSKAISIDDIETELTPDIVAARCTEYTFKGKKLHPFTKTRQTAAVSMGTKVFTGVGDRDANGVYPEMYLDAQKIVWLCVVDDAAARRACSNPNTAISLCLDWWEEEGGNIGGAEHAEIMDLYSDILTDLQTVSAEPDSTGSKGGSESLGE